MIGCKHEVSIETGLCIKCGVLVGVAARPTGFDWRALWMKPPLNAPTPLVVRVEVLGSGSLPPRFTTLYVEDDDPGYLLRCCHEGGEPLVGVPVRPAAGESVDWSLDNPVHGYAVIIPAHRIMSITLLDQDVAVADYSADLPAEKE